VIPRGGSTAVLNPPGDRVDVDEDEEEEEARRTKRAEDEERRKLSKFRSDQQVLLQLRSTFLTEALAKRGLPVATVAGVSTADGDRPPEATDWECALSTHDDPKTCLYSFDAEPGTKVVAPISTTQWISLSALNRLRRTDSAKVEPMWHGKYAILKSWFGDESEFSLLQHVGFGGFLVSSVLLDLGNGWTLRSLLMLAVLMATAVVMPLAEYIVGRALVSAPFWARWYSWHRIAHAALPLKLLLGQIAWKTVAGAFSKLEGRVRDYVVDMECAILERCVPVTIGAGVETDDHDEPEGGEGGFLSTATTDNDDSEEEYDDDDW